MFEVYIIIICLMLSMLFSSFEISLLDISPFNIIRISRKKYLHWVYKKKEILLQTCLIGSNLAIVTATLLLSSFANDDSSLLQNILMFIVELLLFFMIAELIPKLIGSKLNFTIFKYSFPIIFIFYLLFFPFIIVLNFISNALLFITASKKVNLKREDFFHFIGSHSNKEELYDSLMVLEQTKISEIMTPFSRFYTIRQDSTVKECLELVNKTSFSRFPIVDHNRNNLVIGYIEIRDIYHLPIKTPIKNFIKKSKFIPKYLSIHQVLVLMQKDNLPIVFVVSELANIMGLITIKDIAEEIVGEIITKEQPWEELIVPLKDKSKQYILSGHLDIDDFNEFFDLNLIKDDYKTLAGYLLKKASKIPNNNEVINTTVGKFTILDASSYQINKVVFKKYKVSF